MNLLIRVTALKWWNSFTIHSKRHYLDLWRESLPESSFKRSWTLPMIDTSTSTIVLIYEYINGK